MSAKKLYSLTPIQSPSDWEIDTILNQYFKSESPLSRKYWPRRLRDFVRDIFILLSEREDLHNELSQAAQNTVNKVILCDISARLQSSKENTIHSKERKFIGRVLRSIRLHRGAMKLSIKQPGLTTGDLGESCNWPSDIDDIADIFQSLSKRTLRRDIAAFFFNTLKSIVTVEWKLNFLGSSIDLSSETQKPFEIEVEASEVANVEQHLKVISTELACWCQGLLPIDMTDVKPLKGQGSTALSEEAFYTSGGIWKEGALGCVLMSGNKTYGLTCHHVHSSSSLLGKSQNWTEFNDICASEGNVFSLKNPSMDCSFFEINSALSNAEFLIDISEKSVDSTDDRSTETIEVDNAMKPSTSPLVSLRLNNICIYNLLPLKFLTADALRVQVGEDVFKMGKQTGLTIGKLRAMSVFFQDVSTGEQYHDAVEVEWVGAESRFAAHGDCGSLYCVRRGDMFVPIAIHRASSSSCASYGSNFWEALDVLPDEGNSALCFLNPRSFAR